MKEAIKKWFGPSLLLAVILGTIGIVGYGQPSTGGGTGPVPGPLTLIAGANIVVSTNGGNSFTIAASGTLSSQVYASNVVSGGKLIPATIPSIPLSGLSQSGASGGQVAQWNGSAWVPTSPTNGTAIPITVTATNFVLNTVYTNNSGTVIGVDASVALHGAAVAGVASMELWADQSGGNNFTRQDICSVSTLLTSIVTDYTNNLSGFITNLGTYFFTNSSSGSGNLSSIVPGTGEVVTFGNIFAAGNVVLTTVQNTFTTDQYFTQNINVSGKARVSYFVVTNQVAYVPKAWTTATNTLDVSLTSGASHWTNITYTPCAVTGFSSDAGYNEQGVLRLKNASSSNVTFTCSAPNIHLPTQDPTNPYTLTNGDWLEFWVEIDNDCTNILIKTWH